MIRAFEEISMNALPALKSMYYDGWIIRFAKAYSRRANSVNPIYHSTIDVEEKIRRCENLYRSAGQRVIFKLTDAVFPEDLDAELKRRGYEVDAPVSIQTLDLRQVDYGIDNEIIITDEPRQEWEKRFIAMSNTDTRHLRTMQVMLSRIVPTRGFFSIVRKGEIVACGLAVLQDGYVGLFDILTDPKCRREGLGTRISLSMIAWGRKRGAQTAYLQVMTVNEPALRLYENLGFAEVYKYWYRVKE
jgi:ribosomal protein S18 acetylase RimI-like enzyme